MKSSAGAAMMAASLFLYQPVYASTLSIGSTAIENPAAGANAVSVSIPGTIGDWWGRDQSGSGWSYTAATNTLTIGNIADPDRTKYVLLTVVMDSDQAFQAPGSPFNPGKWPGLSAAGTVTPTAASYYAGANFTWVNQLQETIFPQPASESFSFANLSDFFDHIQSVGVDTICVPEPATWAMLLTGFAIVAAAAGARRRAEATA